MHKNVQCCITFKKSNRNIFQSTVTDRGTFLIFLFLCTLCLLYELIISGNLTCPETNGTPGEALQPCLDMLADNYKFVLAFERFICEDFVTKRFFDILSRDTIPIVFG